MMDAGAWDARYAESSRLWSLTPNVFLVPEVRDLAPGRALDLAAGEGRNAVWLAEQGWEVTAADFSAVAADRVRELAAARGVELEVVVADVTTWVPPAETYDLVIVFYLHLPAPALRTVLAGATAALRPGGTILVVGHDVENLTRGYGGPQDVAILYDPEELAAELADLDIVTARRVERTVEVEGGTRVAIDTLVRAVRRE